MNQKIFRIITHTDVSKIVFALLQNPDSTVHEIEQLTNIPKTNVYRIVTSLEIQGLIASKTNKIVDNRSVRTFRTKFSRLSFIANQNGMKLTVK